MTLPLQTEIPRTLDALLARFTHEARPGLRVEAWLFEDAPARAAAERALAQVAVQARVRSAYKPLLHFMLDEAGMDGLTAAIIRTPIHPGGSQARFRLEAYPLAGLLSDDATLSFEFGSSALEYELSLKRADGVVATHRVFAPNRAFTDHLGRETLAPCGWLRVWQDDALIEDAQIETEFEAAFRVVMEAVAAHPWGDHQPFFDVLKIVIETGGIERALAYVDECISTREALHEDLYFSLLEFFQHVAGRPPGDRSVQPGQIVPDIRPGQGPTRVTVALLPPQPLAFAQAAATSLDLADRPLTPDELSDELALLGGTRFDGRSVQGRPVWATHIAGAAPGVVISAGQHANETSGIVGALRAAKLLAARGVDFALIPLINPDGHALHHRLRAIHPRHMHHAARYTALGDDLESRTAEPFYEKATRLEAYRRTRAGLHLNLHGYPSHEWTRPLTAYAPQGFESWAIPRGFFLIVRHGPGLGEAADAFLRALCARVAEVPGLRAYNERHLATYAAHAGAKPEIVYDSIPCLLNENAAPDVPVTLISEYPDETIYDDAFRLAHAAQTATVVEAVALYRQPGGMAELCLALRSQNSVA